MSIFTKCIAANKIAEPITAILEPHAFLKEPKINPLKTTSSVIPARGPPESIVLLTAPITDSLEKSPFAKVPFVKKMQQHKTPVDNRSAIIIHFILGAGLHT